MIRFEDWKRLSSVPSFGRLLMAAPLAPDDLPERDRSPMRDSAAVMPTAPAVRQP